MIIEFGVIEIHTKIHDQLSYNFRAVLKSCIKTFMNEIYDQLFIELV